MFDEESKYLIKICLTRRAKLMFGEEFRCVTVDM